MWKSCDGRGERHTKVLVEGTGELVERRGHLKALLEDAALALDAHNLGPLDEAVEVLLGRQRAADPELLRPLLEQRIRHHLHQNQTRNGINLGRNNDEHNRLHESVAYRLLLGGNRRLASSLRGLQDYAIHRC